MTPFFISPPFGSYLDYPTSTSVLGSYTLHQRRWRAYKTLQFFWDNWHNPISNGWVNRIGLRNPGIGSVQFNRRHLHLYSLVGLDPGDWETMFAFISSGRADTHIRFELNLGCPNVHEYGIEKSTLRDYCLLYWCGVKLPADRDKALKIAAMAVDAGVRYLHAGNTFATERGGVSGYPLKPINLAIVEALAKEFPGVNLVGGGGIYSFADLVDYRNAGAMSYSLGTVCFRPWRAKAIMRQYQEHYGV